MNRLAFDLLLAVLTSLVFAGAIIGTVRAEEIHKIIGPDGKVTYSSTPMQGAGGKASVLEIQEQSGLGGVSAADKVRVERIRANSIARANEAATLRQAPIFFYATWCGYCKRASAFLKKHNVAVRAIDVDTPDGSRARKEMNLGTGVPILVVGDQVVRGWNQTRYVAALGLR